MHRPCALIPVGLLLAAMAAGAARAADDTGKPADDAIMATRKELEALKTEPLLSTGTKLALPTLDSPTDGPPVLAPTPAQTAQQPDGFLPVPGKSSGWLMDAMNKNAPRSDDRRGRGSDGSPGAGAGTGGSQPEGPRGTADRADNGGNAADQRSGQIAGHPAAPNPLTPFMAGWMASDSFDLLMKSHDPDRIKLPGEAWIDFNQRLALPDSADFTAAPTGPDLGDPAPRAVPGMAEATQNPYLQNIAQPDPVHPGAGTLPPQAPVPPPSAQTLAEPPPPPADATPAFLQELQKRDDDAKYFPQLKHF